VHLEHLEAIEGRLVDLRGDILAEKEVRKTALDALESKLMEEVGRVEKTVREEIRLHNTGMQTIMTRLSILEQSMGFVCHQSHVQSVFLLQCLQCLLTFTFSMIVMRNSFVKSR
jgi:hypothetical protein